MKRILIISGFLIFVINLNAQQWEWAKPLTGDKDNFFVDITCPDNSGKIYATGNFGDTITFSGSTFVNPLTPTSDNFVSSAFISAITPNGNVSWLKILYGKEVKTTAVSFYKNKIYATGSYSDTLFVDNDTLVSPFLSMGLNESIYLICLDTLGNTIFVRDYGYSKGYYPDAMAVSDSGIYLSGTFNEYLFFNNDTITPPVFPDFFLTKTNLNGDRLWTKSGYYYYGKRYRRATNILIDSQNNLYISGYYKSLFVYENDTVSGSNVFIIKSDAQGNPVQFKNFCQGDSVEVYDARILGDTIYYSGSSLSGIILGNDTITTPLGTQKAFLTQMDTGLNILKNIITNQSNTKGNCLSYDKSGNLYWSVQFDTAITLLNQTFSNSYLPNLSNHAIVKITGFNIMRYMHLITGGQYQPLASAVDEQGNYYIGGFNNSTQYYDTTQFVINGIKDGFLSKISCRPDAPGIFSNDTTICWNEQKDIWVNSSGYLTPLWQNGSNDTLITTQQPGNYYCWYFDENGCQSDTGKISIYGFPRSHASLNQWCDSLFVNAPNTGEWWYEGTYLGVSNSWIATNNGWYVYQNLDSNGCATIDSIFFNKQPYALQLNPVCDSLVSSGANGEVVWYQNNSIVDTAFYYIVSQSGDYYYTYTDSLGCTWSSDTITLDVSRFSEVIEIYPNPVVENLWIKGLYEGHLRIYDMSGKLEASLTFDFSGKKGERCSAANHKIPVDISGLKKGLHFIQIESNGFIWSDKILKQ